MRYIVSTCDGDEVFVAETKQDAFKAAELEVQQQLCDHFRHQLPLKITPEIAERFGVEIFPAATKPMALPLQKWVDEYYADLQKREKDLRLKDLKRFLSLWEQFEKMPHSELEALASELENIAYAEIWQARIKARLEKTCFPGAPQDG